MKEYLLIMMVLIICGCFGESNNVQGLINEGSALFEKGPGTATQ